MQLATISRSVHAFRKHFNFELEIYFGGVDVPLRIEEVTQEVESIEIIVFRKLVNSSER